MTLSQWLKNEKIPALEIKDTRLITQILRDEGSMLGKIIIRNDVEQFDPNSINIVERVSTKKIIKEMPFDSAASNAAVAQARSLGRNKKSIVILDCGAKRNIARCFHKRGVSTITVPWDFDPFAPGVDFKFDALFISNGPGDPKKATKTIATIKKSLQNKIPTLGICLGNQLLALAAGGDTEKLKFGHRSQNQPCLLAGSNRCYITTQNHGFAISKVPQGFETWFTNVNDGTIEGIKHKSLPFMAVQFHPEATPGPKDTEWVFDFFLEKIGIKN